MSPKKVSFIIAAFNEEPFVGECISSCLQQSHSNTEVCITDDGSSDGTWSILDAEYATNDRVKLHRFDRNCGKVAAFNSSYLMATGDYIAIIGADDVNYPDRIEKQLRHIQENNLDLTCGGLDIADIKLNKISSIVLDIPLTININNILENNIVAGGTILMTKQCAELIFPMPEKLPFEDWWIGYKAALLGRIGYLPEALMMYRQHAGNAAGGSDKSNAAQARSNFKRHFAVYALIKEDINAQNSLKKRRELLGIIDGNVSYKRICIEDSIMKRFAIVIGNLKAISHLSKNIKLKLICIIFLGFPAFYKVKKLLNHMHLKVKCYRYNVQTEL